MRSSTTGGATPCISINAIFEPEMEDTVEVENLLHVGFTPESHGQYSKVRMLDADVKEAMAEYDRVHGTQS